MLKNNNKLMRYIRTANIILFKKETMQYSEELQPKRHIDVDAEVLIRNY